MTKEGILALIRHGLTAFGGLLVNSGLTTAENMEVAAGAFVIVLGFGWSLWRKWSRKKKTGSPA